MTDMWICKATAAGPPPVGDEPGWRSAAAAGTAAAAAAGLRRRRRGACPAADRDRGQQLHGVVVALGAGAGCGRLAHRARPLESVAAGAAAVFVSWHEPSVSARARRGEDHLGQCVTQAIEAVEGCWPEAQEKVREAAVPAPPSPFWTSDLTPSVAVTSGRAPDG